jgi:outer membrane protein, heavy metal efflux system
VKSQNLRKKKLSRAVFVVLALTTLLCYRATASLEPANSRANNRNLADDTKQNPSSSTDIDVDANNRRKIDTTSSDTDLNTNLEQRVNAGSNLNANGNTNLDANVDAVGQATTSNMHRKFSLTACFNQADQNNKEILVATTNLPIAQAAVVIGKAIPNPTYSMQYGFGPAWQYIVAGNNQVVGWTEEIQVAGRRTKKIEVAKANYLQTAISIQATRFSVHNRVRRSYAELAAATAYGDLIETQREIAQNLLRISQKRFDAGKAPGAEVLQAKLNVMQFATQRNQAQGRLVQDSAAMALLLGETPVHEEIMDVDATGLFKLSTEKSLLVPQPSQAMPPLPQLLPAAWRERNDLKAAIQQAYGRRKSLTLAKTQRIPDPTAGFSYMFSTYKTFQPIYFDPNGTGTASAGNKVPFQPGYLFTYSQEMPIFYRYQGQIDQAQAVWLQQLKQNERMRSQIASEIVSAYVALQLSRANIKKFQEELLPAGLLVSQLSRRSYELGKADLATAILAQQQYQQLRANYFDSIVAYQNAWADLEKAVGVPLAF